MKEGERGREGRGGERERLEGGRGREGREIEGSEKVRRWMQTGRSGGG